MQKINQIIEECAEKAPTVAFEPTGIKREIYLNWAEKIVRMACVQEPNRRAVDFSQAISSGLPLERIMGTLGGLIGAGRCLDLLPTLEELTLHLVDIYVRQTQGSAPWLLCEEIFIKELGWMFFSARESLSAETARRVSEAIREAQPAYRKARSENVSFLHAYALAGEQMLRASGMREKDGVIERYVPFHLRNFVQDGLYAVPERRVVWEWMGRLHLSLLLWAGYDGEGSDEISERLSEGALTQILLHNAQGLSWFGGGESQWQFNEMELAVICEYEADRLAEENPILAGMFRRAARTSLKAIEKWLEMEPPRGVKNGFFPVGQWGFFNDMSQLSLLLLTASLMTFAYHISRREIAEYTLPAEIGSYAIDIPEFQQAFASRKGMSLQWDLKGNLDFDATGLGRVLWGKGPLQIGLISPISAKSALILPRLNSKAGPKCEKQIFSPASISCAWKYSDEDKWHRLAEAQPENYIFSSSVNKDNLLVRIIWKLGKEEVIGEFHLGEDEIEVNWRVEGASSVRAEWPLMLTDGEKQGIISSENNALALNWENSRIEITALSEASAKLMEGTLANLNGLYRVGIMEREGEVIKCRMKIRLEECKHGE